MIPLVVFLTGEGNKIPKRRTAKRRALAGTSKGPSCDCGEMTDAQAKHPMRQIANSYERLAACGRAGSEPKPYHVRRAA
jgi:hypothetical protein